MALSDRAYVRLPPDGAGKALVVDYMIYAEYNTATGPFRVDDVVVGSISGTLGKVVQSIPVTALQGRVGIHLAFPNLANNFAVGERLLVEGVEIATIVLLEEVHVSRTQVVGSNNPNFGQRVDAVGAASVRFEEGSPAFDAFGRLQVSQALMLGEYRTPYDTDTERFSYQTVGGGSVVYEGTSGGVILRTDTAVGSKAMRTTNKYHAYQPGSSQLAQMSLSCSHSGQPGTRMRWGYYDDSNGLFFQLDGDGTLNIVLRSSNSGAVVDTVIPRDDWNGDQLDGTGDSLIDIDVSMLALWWLDFGWYGANRIRFGIYDSDGRVTCHTIENANVRPRSFMRTARLPLRAEIENLSASGSTTELYLLSASVKAEGQIDRPVQAYGGADAPTTTVTGTGWKSLFGFRPAAVFKGRENRVFVMPTSATVHAVDATTGEPAAIKVACVKAPDAVTSANFVSLPSNPNSALQFDPFSAGQAVAGGRILGIWMGDGLIDANLKDVFNYTNGESVALNADGTLPRYYVAAMPVDPAQSIKVTVVSNWHEVQ